MANDFKNTSLVTRYAVKEFLNALVMGAKVDRQLDDSKVFSGKVGASVSIRRPVYFEATDGATISSTPDVEEAIVPFTLDQRKKVNFTVSAQDLTLKIEDANERYIKPAMQELAQKVESSIAGAYTEIPNFVGTPGTGPSTFLHVGACKAAMTRLGAPHTDLYGFWSADAALAIADGLKGVYVQGSAKNALQEAAVGRYGGLDNFESNSLASHTVGTWGTSTILIDDAGTTSTTYAASKDTNTQVINLDGFASSSTAACLKAGDVITIAGVNSVNRKTREDTGNLQTFVVTADTGASTGTTDNITATVSPPIIISGPYQTVTAAPADDAAVTVLTGASGTTHLQNMTFHKNAITLACVPLDVITDGANGARENFGGISIKTQRQYDFDSDSLKYRFDILYGVKVQNGSMACRRTS